MKRQSTTPHTHIHTDRNRLTDLLRQHLGLALCGVLLLTLPTQLRAQSDLSSLDVFSGEESVFYEDLPSVYGASKYEQKVTEAPSSVSIVTTATDSTIISTTPL